MAFRPLSLSLVVLVAVHVVVVVVVLARAVAGFVQAIGRVQTANSYLFLLLSISAGCLASVLAEVVGVDVIPQLEGEAASTS